MSKFILHKQVYDKVRRCKNEIAVKQFHLCHYLMVLNSKIVDELFITTFGIICLVSLVLSITFLVTRYTGGIKDDVEKETIYSMIGWISLCILILTIIGGYYLRTNKMKTVLFSKIFHPRLVDEISTNSFHDKTAEKIQKIYESDTWNIPQSFDGLFDDSGEEEKMPFVWWDGEMSIYIHVVNDIGYVERSKTIPSFTPTIPVAGEEVNEKSPFIV